MRRFTSDKKAEPLRPNQRKGWNSAPELEEIIALVNMVPAETDLPDLAEIHYELSKINLDGDVFSERALESLTEHLGGVSEAFRDYILEGLQRDDPEGLLASAWRRYNEFRDFRSCLQELARVGTKLNPQRVTSFEQLPEHLKMKTKFYLEHYARRIERKVLIACDEQGKLILKADRLAKALQGMELSRIRLCGSCQRIYWAGRANMRYACSTKCANLLRTRRWRDEEKRKEEGN